MSPSSQQGGVDDVQIIQDVHVSGLGVNLHKLNCSQRATLGEFKALVLDLPEAVANEDFIDDAVLVNFLIARDWTVQKSLKMISSALQWRIKRPSHRWILGGDDKRSDDFRYNSSLGKIRVTGNDRYGRPVMVFDNSKENASDPDEMLEYLAWNMELCKRTARDPAVRSFYTLAF